MLRRTYGAFRNPLTHSLPYYDSHKTLADEAGTADLIIACHREEMPRRQQALHVLPQSTDDIFVYMMQGDVLIISDEKIAFYDILLAVRNNQAEVVQIEPSQELP